MLSTWRATTRDYKTSLTQHVDAFRVVTGINTRIVIIVVLPAAASMLAYLWQIARVL